MELVQQRAQQQQPLTPCDAVKVLDIPPAASDPCTAPAAPASLCITVTAHS